MPDPLVTAWFSAIAALVGLGVGAWLGHAIARAPFRPDLPTRPHRRHRSTSIVWNARPRRSRRA